MLAERDFQERSAILRNHFLWLMKQKGESIDLVEQSCLMGRNQEYLTPVTTLQTDRRFSMLDSADSASDSDENNISSSLREYLINAKEYEGL